jgi:hypothetical protein
MLVIEISLATLDTSRAQNTIAPAGLLSRPTPCRSTPITTTALRFSIYLDAEGAMEARLIA